MVTLSSTACVLRVLRDRAEIDSQFGRASLGILLVQDVAVVPMMILVTAMAEGGSIGSILGKIALSILLSLLLVTAFYVVFNWLIPRVLIMPTWRQNRDLPVLLTTCMVGAAAVAAHALNLSPALGAFVAGVLLAVSPFAVQIQADIQPLRALFVTLFFAAIGMFGDLGWLLQNIGLVLAIFTAIIAVKVLLVAGLTRLVGLHLQFAVATGFCLSQIGEFAFVLGTIARGDGGPPSLLSHNVFMAMISATILTLFVTPYLVAIGPRVGGWVDRQLIGRWQSRSARATAGSPVSEPTPTTAESEVERMSDTTDGVLIIGFGPAGQRAVQGLLPICQQSLIVIELNIENVEIAQELAIEAHLGDATQTDTLLHAGIQKARMVVITIPNPATVRRVIYNVRHLAPSATIIVRSRYHLYHWTLAQAGADAVVDEEDHVGAQIALEAKKHLEC
jgi:CPA2 family monovalent cation:H+ antiporter-2